MFHKRALWLVALLQKETCNLLQQGEDALDAVSSWVSFRKRALYLVALLRKETRNLWHPMYFGHPVLMLLSKGILELTVLFYSVDQHRLSRGNAAEISGKSAQ